MVPPFTRWGEKFGWLKGRRLSLLRPEAAAVAFAGSRSDVVALHLVRSRPGGKMVTVLFLTPDPTPPEISVYFEELQVRWSLSFLTVPVRTTACASQMLCTFDGAAAAVSAACTRGCDTIITGWRRAELNGLALLKVRAEKSLARVTWLDPIWHYGDREVARYIDRFQLPVCSLHRKISTAAEDLQSKKDLMERMRGLGYL